MLAGCASNDDFSRYNHFGPNRADLLKFELVDYDNPQALE